MLSKLLFSMILLLFLSSCDMSYKSDRTKDDYLIGEILANFSKLANESGTDQNKIAMFDESVRKVHLFDLNQNKLVASVDVVESSNQDKHAVLYDENGNYIVDITSGGFAITDKYGVSQINPIKLIGKPLSAAFRSDLGILVVYDDVGSIGLLKLSAQGKVLQSWVGGSKISLLSQAVISSGDLLDNQHLVTSLSDGSLAEIDIIQTLNQKKWIYNIIPTTLKTAKWVSRIPNMTSQVLLRISDDSHKIYIFDLDNQTVLDSYTVDGILEKSSRVSNPHLLILSNDKQSMEIIYPENGLLKKIKIPRHNENFQQSILSSRLNLTKDTFSFVESVTNVDLSKDGELSLNDYRTQRTYK